MAHPISVVEDNRIKKYLFCCRYLVIWGERGQRNVKNRTACRRVKIEAFYSGISEISEYCSQCTIKHRPTVNAGEGRYSRHDRVL